MLPQAEFRDRKLNAKRSVELSHEGSAEPSWNGSGRPYLSDAELALGAIHVLGTDDATRSF